ncbi:MAG TPA: 8-amino-7-oxononanoate synthase, partial [Gemmatimonadaceae bacterium]|nr:8-amino-7-oxononanoate synthase [Gemmatimonadaceae bacterium]
DFSSNDYLGLASDPRLAAAAANALREHGTGATASRLIAGNNAEHEALEADVARFFHAERALTFSSGYLANVGIIPALVGRGDAIFSDALNHASLIDGCRLSRADVHVYQHADVGALASLLAEHRSAARRALIVTDGLFSMDGDLAPLAGISDLARRFDAWTYVDDAHAVGVLGNGGRGTATFAGLSDEVDVVVGTLGKAFGAAGAFVYGSDELIQYLLNKARSFVFSTAMLPAQAAAARKGLRIAGDEHGRRDRVAQHARLMRKSFAGCGIETLGEDTSPVVPVLIGDVETTMRVGATLSALGYLVGAVRPPTVPAGTSRLRVTISAAHTAEQIVALAELVADVLRA